MSTIQFHQSQELKLHVQVRERSAGRPAQETPTVPASLDLVSGISLQLSAAVLPSDDGGATPPGDGAGGWMDDPELSREMRKLLTLLEPMLGDGAREVLARLQDLFRSQEPVPAAADLASFTARLQEAVQEISARAERWQVRTESRQDVRVRFEFYAEDSRMVARIEGAMADPLVLDLDGDGLELTGMADGVEFDINADGRTDRTVWVAGDDGLLTLDRNENGIIDDGGELFGDQHGAADGFVELKRFDHNQDGRIDHRDPVFARLQVWQDRNGDGRSGVDALIHLDELGIRSLNLAVREANERRNDALIKQTSLYNRSGQNQTLGEVFFAFETRI